MTVSRHPTQERQCPVLVTLCYRGIHVQSNGQRRESSRAALAQFAMAILTSLISFLLGKRRAASVRDAFRRSKDSYLEFLGIAERRAIVVSPDHRLVWQNAFRLQHLLIQQQYLRFEHLVANHQLGDASRSIASIEERAQQRMGCNGGVKRHPDLTPLRHEELTPSMV
jgi:hypothetical protein